MTKTDVPVATSLVGGRRLAKNTLWSLSGSFCSIAIALLTVPILLKYLGTARFGVVSLVWIVEGQFGIFEGGFGSALTKLVAERLGKSREGDIPAIFWTTLLITFSLGAVGAVILRASASWLVFHVLKVPASIELETLTTFHLVAFSLPAVISTSALRGFLSAHQRFDLLTAARLPISLFSYLAPLLVLPFSNKLGPFIFVLIMARILAWIIHITLCFRASPVLLRRITTVGAPLGDMCRFGGWMTVTNMVGPIMVNMDRFLIGGLISVVAVAYYATPYEVATRLWIISSAVTAVLFPAFASALGHNRGRAALLFERGVKYIFLSLFPVIIGILVLGRLGLQIWLGPAFAERSTTVLNFLAIGIFFNSLAQIPFWCIQAAGRPDLTAKVHLVELPCYLSAFWALTIRHGIDGAGLAWMLRAIVDSAAMFWLCARLLPEVRSAVHRLALACLMAIPLFIAATLLEASPLAIVFLVSLWVAFAAMTWFRFLTVKERELVRNPARFLITKDRTAFEQV